MEAPGYKIKYVIPWNRFSRHVPRLMDSRSIDERTLVHFADNSDDLLEAYVESGEGIDRAGGFAVQVSPILLTIISAINPRTKGLGGILVRKVDGDYQNVVGFPAASFFKFLQLLCEEEDDFLEV